MPSGDHTNAAGATEPAQEGKETMEEKEWVMVEEEGCDMDGKMEVDSR